MIPLSVESCFIFTRRREDLGWITDAWPNGASATQVCRYSACMDILSRFQFPVVNGDTNKQTQDVFHYELLESHMYQLLFSNCFVLSTICLARSQTSSGRSRSTLRPARNRYAILGLCATRGVRRLAAHLQDGTIDR